ncbi:MAG: HD domain-containing protein [Myxococcota bacterium]
MSEDIALLIRAADYAARAHVNQRRKGAQKRPYLNHLLEVSHAVSAHTGAPVEVLCAAILHDIVEDTPVTNAQVRADFGDTVADLVAEVTDDRSLPRDVRKQKQVEHAPHLSEPACWIKIADKTSNVRDLALDPPPTWTLKRMLAYVDWAERVVSALQFKQPGLMAIFQTVCQESRRSFQEKFEGAT